MPVNIKVGEIQLKGHAYYDEKRDHQERNTFYKRLYDLVERLKNVNLKSWMNPGEVFREIAKRDAKFIEWKAVNGRFEVSIRKNDVSQAINKMGKFILLYRGDFSLEESIGELAEFRGDLKNKITLLVTDYFIYRCHIII